MGIRENDVLEHAREAEHPSQSAYTRLLNEAVDTYKNQKIAQATDRPSGQAESDRLRPQVFVKPGESIQRAIDRAPDGAVVNVGEGVYNERININRDNITLKAQGRAVLDLNGRPSDGGVISIKDRHNVSVEGFEIRNVKGGDTPAGIQVDGTSSDINIVNNDIHDIRHTSGNAHAIAVYGNKGNALTNVNIVGNKVHDLKLGMSEAVVVNGNVDRFKIAGNTIRNTDNIGIDVIGYEKVGPPGKDRARNGIIADNLIENVDTKNNPSYKGDRNAAAIYVDGGSDVAIVNNTVRNSNYGIELASEHGGKYTERIAVRRNTIQGSHVAGISLGGGEANNGGARNIIIEDNDLKGNRETIMYQHNVDRSTVIVRNNRNGR